MYLMVLYLLVMLIATRRKEFEKWKGKSLKLLSCFDIDWLQLKIIQFSCGMKHCSTEIHTLSFFL